MSSLTTLVLFSAANAGMMAPMLDEMAKEEVKRLCLFSSCDIVEDLDDIDAVAACREGEVDSFAYHAQTRSPT